MKRCGFTLIELLATIAIIGILAGILMPAISAARESARSAQCSSNLRNFGIALNAHASSDRQGRFCSGGFDWQLDGSVLHYGWVADLVKNGQPVGQMLCPSNTVEVSETIDQLLRIVPPTKGSGQVDTTCVDWLGPQRVELPDGTDVVGPCRFIAENGSPPNSTPMPPLGPERAKIVQEQVVQQYFNTNFVASWLMVRGGVSFGGDGNPASKKVACGGDLRGAYMTDGPLSQSTIDSSKIPASVIPLLADARSVGMLSVPLGERYSAGAMLGANLTLGPVFTKPINGRAVYDYPGGFASGTPMQGAGGWAEVYSQSVRQDYRRFNPLHRNYCNVLMADGSVRSLRDANRDGAINNGFATDQFFQDDTVEVLPTELFSKASLKLK